MSENTATTTPERITPYALAKLWSVVREREVRPQMAYNYCRQGLIKTVRGEDGKLYVERAEVERFLAKQAAKLTQNA